MTSVSYSFPHGLIERRVIIKWFYRLYCIVSHKIHCTNGKLKYILVSARNCKKVYLETFKSKLKTFLFAKVFNTFDIFLRNLTNRESLHIIIYVKELISALRGSINLMCNILFTLSQNMEAWMLTIRNYKRLTISYSS